MPASTSAEAAETNLAGGQPGTALRVMLQRANLSAEQFARRLSQLAAEQGLAQSLNDKTPYKWLRGATPNPPWAALAVFELTDRLGTQLTAADLGWSKASVADLRILPADAGLDKLWTAQGALTAIGRVADQTVGMDRHYLPMSGTALTTPALDWLTVGPAGDPVRADGRRIGAGHAEDLEAIMARLRRMDARHGGGLVLPLAQDCARHLTGILRDYSYTTADGMRLYSATAELHCLAGWLCQDAGRPAQAQRHWLAGLCAAHTASDRAVGAAILVGMSAQASAAGQHGPALQLVRTAQHGHPDPSPRLAAAIGFAAAHAHAVAGEPDTCHAAINAAREALAAASPDTPEPGGAAWLDPVAASIQAGTAFLYLREFEQARHCFTAAISSLDPAARARDTAVAHARLAFAYVGQEKPERACESAAEAASILTRTVDSGRCINYLRQLCEALRPYRRSHPAVTALTAQTETLFSQR